MKELKLLLHVPYYSSFEPALKMAKNFLKSLKSDEKARVRILVNYEGILVLKDFEKFDSLFKELIKEKVEVYFCENALKTFEIPYESVPKGGKTVYSGIKALVEWEEEGFRYVRT